MRVLVVEDEPDLAMAVAVSLRGDGYAVDVATDGASALDRAGVNAYDLVCLDLNLPDGDGLDVCRALVASPHPAAERRPRIIMLTARDSVEDRVRGLDEGADDYLAKPFSLAELGARARALLRRDADTGGAVVSRAGIELDGGAQTVTHQGMPVDLTAKEYALLRWFLLHPDEVHSAERLLEHVWDENVDPFTNTVRTTIYNLRRKLAAAGDGGQPIETLPGRGYRLRDRT
jgi:DNA-binding response OmpR family regulator